MKPTVNNKVKDIWNANANYWDSKMGEGNDFHKKIIEPVQLQLLNLKSGDFVLDVACGNGQFARKMVEFGAKVTAVDFSEKFISIAKSKGTHHIDYQVIDATSENDLKKLLPNAFNAVVCTMALMDMENIDVFFTKIA